MSQQDTLEFTGERFTPECVREMAYEHWHRYAMISEYVAGARVLDAACGEGYGSALLAEQAASVAGVDLSEEAVRHAEERYGRDNLQFLMANCIDLPYEDGEFDVVVSFETLEHLAEQDELLAEFRRVLAPDGWLVISSPDRKTYSDDTGYCNEFHVRELYRHEFEELLARHFGAVRLYGQKLLFNSMIWNLSTPGRVQHLAGAGGHGPGDNNLPDWPPLYYIAVCAARENYFPDMASTSLFCDREESVYAFHREEIRRNIHARGTLEAYEQRIEELERKLYRPWWKRLFGR